jgi:hypothetical protein
MTGNHDSGDGGALPKSNSNVDARLHDLIQAYCNSQKNAAALLVGRCQLLLELEANLPPDESQRFLDHLN